MEDFNPQKNTENSQFDKHKNFTDRCMRVLGNTSLASGSILMLVGICEFVSQDKTGSVLNDYQKDLPDILNWGITHLDKIPDYLKIAGGLTFVNLGRLVKKWNNLGAFEKE